MLRRRLYSILLIIAVAMLGIVLVGCPSGSGGGDDGVGEEGIGEGSSEGETTEGSGEGAGEGEITGETEDLADLVATLVDFESSTILEGDEIWIEVFLSNDGNAPSSVTHAKLWISIDDDLDTSDDFFVNEIEVLPIEIAEETQVRWNFVMPDLGVVPYPIWFIVSLDSREIVRELDEDNLYRSSIAFTVGDYEIEIGPSALFSATPTFGVVPFDVDFMDLSIAGNAPIVSWEWNIGGVEWWIQS